MITTFLETLGKKIDLADVEKVGCLVLSDFPLMIYHIYIASVLARKSWKPNRLRRRRRALPAICLPCLFTSIIPRSLCEVHLIRTSHILRMAGHMANIIKQMNQGYDDLSQLQGEALVGKSGA